jgi:predicted 3-demethylubiquinone-9 3-methyltransferase (glyoxalase superfamily)
VAVTRRMTPCLWFDDQAEDAAKYYVGVFRNSWMAATTRYSSAGKEVHGRPAGSVMTVDFELDGTPFTALNGGPHFKFNEAVSFQVFCESQEEIDYFWEKLTAGGDPKAQQCGWLKDRFGLSWQVVPTGMDAMLANPESEGAKRAMEAFLTMKKIDLAKLERAFAGKV